MVLSFLIPWDLHCNFSFTFTVSCSVPSGLTHYKDSSSNGHCLASVVLCHSCPRASLWDPLHSHLFHVWNTSTAGMAWPSSINSACTTASLDHSRFYVLTLGKLVPRPLEFSLIQIFSKLTEYSQIICKKNHEKPHTESVLLSNPQPRTNWASSICTYLSTLVLQTSPMMQQQTLQHLGAFPARSSIFVYILLLTYQSQRHNKITHGRVYQINCATSWF